MKNYKLQIINYRNRKGFTPLEINSNARQNYNFSQKTGNGKSLTGFTLIEMLIVIAIIAILSSVFLVGLQGFRGGAYDSRRISDLQKVQSYLEVYYNSSSRQYPQAGTGWSSLQTALQGSGSGISNVPNDPISSQNYIYCANSSRQSYVLGAQLSNPNHSALGESYHDVVTDYTCTATLDCASGSGWLCVKF